MASPRSAAAVILIRHSGPEIEVFWVRRAQHMAFQGGYHAFPGGQLDPNEDARICAAREVFEETGLSVRIVTFLDVQTDIHRDRHSNVKYHYVLVDFLATPTGGRLRRNPEASDMGWFSPKEAKALRITTGTKRVLELAKRKMARSNAASEG